MVAGLASLVVMPTDCPEIASKSKGRVPIWSCRVHTALSFGAASETGPGLHRNKVGGEGA